MTAIDWIPGDTAHAVLMVGKGNPNYPDTINRCLRQALSLSGLDPDADFTGFQPLATAFTRAAADALYAATGVSYTKAEAAALFAVIGASYLKAESDARYALASTSYDKAASDAKYAALSGATFTGQITANAGVVGQMGFRATTQNTTLTAADQVLIVNAASNNVLVNLPAATLGKYAWTVCRTDSSAFTVTVVAAGSDAIVGTATLAKGETASVVLDGASKAYVLHGVAATSLSASNVTGGAFPENVSFAGDAAFNANAAFETGAFFNGAVVYQVGTATLGATRTISFSSSYYNALTLTANCTLSFSNANQGAAIEVLFKQDATGSRTLTWPGTAKLPTGFSIASAANAATLVRIWFDGSAYWVQKLADY